MTKWMRAASAGLALIMLGLAGCAPSEGQEEGQSSVTWEEAKAAAQARELEIVALIPANQVVAVDQHETGTLFSCSETQHRWTGITYVTLVPGIDAEALTKRMEAQVAELFSDDEGVEVTNRRGITDKYVVTAESPTTNEAYLFGEGEPGTISIDSWSVCFTLPEGTYPGGSF
ncbi:hypothetical protein ACI2IP_04560 [Microbacterium sp. NPDC090218]